MSDDELTFGSLFAGIGGFDLGLERAGLRGLWQCEIDPYALRVLEKHWPAVLRVPDVRNVNARTVPAVDVISGGFPCQDLSVAGTGEGLDGARSGLWGEMLRVIRDLRPRYVLVENVAALLARGLGRVLGDLAASGYDAEWDCVPASAVGAPHRRDRIWIVAYPRRDPLRDQPGRRDGPDRPGTPQPGHDGRTGPVADPLGARLEGHGPGTNGTRPAARSGPDAADPERPGLQGPARSWLEGPGRPASLPAGGGTGDVADADAVGWNGRSGKFGPRRRSEPAYGGRGAEHWAVEPDVGRVADGVPARVDRLRGLGNALVPQLAQWLGERVRAAESQRWD